MGFGESGLQFSEFGVLVAEDGGDGGLHWMRRQAQAEILNHSLVQIGLGSQLPRVQRLRIRY